MCPTSDAQLLSAPPRTQTPAALVLARGRWSIYNEGNSEQSEVSVLTVDSGKPDSNYVKPQPKGFSVRT